jgi:carbon monoxide dehydrogenase subunit G
MTEVESKVVAIKNTSEFVFNALSDFRNFNSMVNMVPDGQLTDWQADENTCRFKVKGFDLGLKFVEKEPYKTLKLTGDGKVPFEFFFWIQLKEVAPYDVRMKLTVHADLNMMMKMMLKGKLQDGVDKMAEQIAMAFSR